MRICTRCKKSKLERFFYKRKDRKSGFKSECKVCCDERTKDWQKTNTEKNKELKRNTWRKNKTNYGYPLTLKDKIADLLGVSRHTEDDKIIKLVIESSPPTTTK